MSNALTPEQQRAMVAAYTIPLPEPAFGFLVVSEETGQWIGSRAGEAAFDADNLHAHAAAVSAAKAAEIAQLREYLDAAQRRGEELRAEVAALTENGPPMQRGTTIEGTPWMGTMREVLEDYKSAADTEARWGDEARAEVAGLRDELLREHADHKETIEDAATVVHQNTALRERIKVLEDALRAADAAFEAVEIFMPGGCKEEFAFYADWEDVRSALGDKTPTTQPPSPSPRS